MKAYFLLVIVLLSIAGLGWCQNSGCGKPHEFLDCQQEVSKAGNDFCKVLSKIKSCLDNAQCPKEIFTNIKEAAEKGSGIKCGARALAVQTATLVMTVLGALAFKTY